MHTSIYWMPDPASRLAILARPRPGTWLPDDVAQWRAAGITNVVSLLMPAEVAELDLRHEPETCAAVGIDFRSFPIPDRGVPSSREQFANLIHDLRVRHLAGACVGVHCRMGIGRSSLVIAGLLVRSEEALPAEFRRISTARGLPVPDTDQQRQWLARWAENRGPDPR